MSQALGNQSTPSPGNQGLNASQDYDVNRNNSIEMADVSNLSIDGQNSASSRQDSTDDVRIREKAREAQEQVGRC